MHTRWLQGRTGPKAGRGNCQKCMQETKVQSTSKTRKKGYNHDVSIQASTSKHEVHKKLATYAPGKYLVQPCAHSATSDSKAPHKTSW